MTKFIFVTGGVCSGIGKGVVAASIGLLLKVRGLKVVTGTGELLDLNRGLIKNNTGLDFRHLFAGSEGILGVIVEATLGLCAPPKDPRVVVLGVPDLDDMMGVLTAIQSRLNLLAYEFFSELALTKVVEHQGLHQMRAQHEEFRTDRRDHRLSPPEMVAGPSAVSRR